VSGRTALLGAYAALLSACATLDPRTRASMLAEHAGLRREEVQAGMFRLTTFSRVTRVDTPLHVYIEGDGLAWVSRTQPSTDPTPRRATGLALAAADPAANVLYLARPCQFTPRSRDPHCGVTYWTGRRFAPEVVRAAEAAIDHYTAGLPGERLDLVGFSGGGALAVLVAAGRRDVESLRTVAGDLDTEYVNRLHQVSSMPESLNPIEAAPRVADIAQLHFAGGADTVVPPAVAQRFIAATGGRCARLRTVPDLGHDGDWGRLWPTLLAIPPACAAPGSP
jgi:dienelactone hydrolase